MVMYIVVLGIALFVLERVRPSRPFVSSKHWYFRAIGFNILALAVVVLGAITWDQWFQAVTIFKLNEDIPNPVKGLIIYVVFHFFFYWWHRAKHKYKILWKLFHQLHHSIQRIEVLSSNYLHPLDTASGLILGSLVAYALLGVDLEAAAWFSLYLGCMGYFLHSNLQVPRWLGYIIQTPQMHRRHHEYGKHDSNYCDIVWFDMIFGTYINPVEPCDRCGFDDEKESKVVDMLVFKDVYEKI